MAKQQNSTKTVYLNSHSLAECQIWWQKYIDQHVWEQHTKSFKKIEPPCITLFNEWGVIKEPGGRQLIFPSDEIYIQFILTYS